MLRRFRVTYTISAVEYAEAETPAEVEQEAQFGEGCIASAIVGAVPVDPQDIEISYAIEEVK